MSNWSKSDAGRDYHATWQRNKDKLRRAQGNCIDCGLPSKPHWRCKECRIRVNKRRAKHYQKIKELAEVISSLRKVG